MLAAIFGVSNSVILTYIQASKRQETLLPCDIVHKECLPKILDQPVFHTYRCKYSFFIMFDISRATLIYLDEYELFSYAYLFIFSKNNLIPPMESNRNAQLIIPSKFCFPELNDIIESRGLWMLKLCENKEYDIH